MVNFAINFPDDLSEQQSPDILRYTSTTPFTNGNVVCFLTIMWFDQYLYGLYIHLSVHEIYIMYTLKENCQFLKHGLATRTLSVYLFDTRTRCDKTKEPIANIVTQCER